MSDLDPQEEKSRERESKSAKLAGWVLFILALVVAAIVLGPCDPAPEPIPAGPQATTTGLHEGVPAESTSSSSSTSTTAGETSTGSTG